MKKKLSERQKAEGEENKATIVRILNHAYPKGKSISQLKNETGFARDTIYVHLQSLMKEKNVEKIKVKQKGHWIEYRTTDVYQVSKQRFARLMKLIPNKMIDTLWLKEDIIRKTRLNLPTYDFITEMERSKGRRLSDSGKIAVPKGEWQTFEEMEDDRYDRYLSWFYGLTEPEGKFLESMRRNDVTISHKYCQTRFNRAQKKEKYAFEFANRIGAFIEYIFIESMKSNDESIAKLIIDNAIDLNRLFKNFQILFSVPFSKQNADPDDISKAFRNVYPSGRILEDYWSDIVQLSKTFRVENTKPLIESN